VLETAIRAARAAGRVLLEGSRGELKVDKMLRHDVKLEMDKKAEAVILGIIRERFPDHTILSEEIGRVGPESEYLWVVDPLDGTVNYSRRIPLWATSVALCRGGKEIIGVIYDAVHDELYTAEKGKGAFLNGRPMRVSARTMEQAAIAYGYAANDSAIAEGLRAAERVTRAASKIRASGSAALHLGWVACGRVDGFYEYGLSYWDIAPGVVLIGEAGGRVDQRPRPDGSIDFLCDNGVIHEELKREAGGGRAQQVCCAAGGRCVRLKRQNKANTGGYTHATGVAARQNDDGR